METGDWTWLKDRPYGAWIRKGDKAGSLSDDGYIVIQIDKIKYKAHILAWFYVTGIWPNLLIDHANTLKFDNSWINLREATPSQNLANRQKAYNNKSGFKGVCWNKSRSNWLVQLRKNGKAVFKKGFKRIERAAQEYDKAALIHFGPYASLNFPELRPQYQIDISTLIE